MHTYANLVIESKFETDNIQLLRLDPKTEKNVIYARTLILVNLNTREFIYLS